MNFGSAYETVIALIVLIVVLTSCASHSKRRDPRFRGWPFNQERD
jgi:hypothetical protein